MSTGKLIVIDGIDGSGKKTQADLLLERLKNEGHDAVKIDFPKYGQKSAGLVENYLNGKYGRPDEVGPYAASLFYALDRFDSAGEMRQWLTDGKIIVCDRYVSANMGHQGSKFASTEERRKYFEWLAHYEYDILGAPRPHLTIILHVPAEKAQMLVAQKSERAYTQGKALDAHEADLEHLKRAEQAYVEMCELFPKYELIECVQNDKLLSIKEIHELIWNKVKTLV